MGASLTEDKVRLGLHAGLVGKVDVSIVGPLVGNIGSVEGMYVRIDGNEVGT